MRSTVPQPNRPPNWPLRSEIHSDARAAVIAHNVKLERDRPELKLVPPFLRQRTRNQPMQSERGSKVRVDLPARRVAPQDRVGFEVIGMILDIEALAPIGNVQRCVAQLQRGIRVAPFVLFPPPRRRISA